VFGAGPDGEVRRQHDSPVVEKPVWAELGGVTPVIVVPGAWTTRDIRFQAEHIVSQKMHNAGFNCVGAQILVVPEDWEQTDELVDAVREVLSETPGRRSYYPGSAERCERMTVASEGSETFGGAYPRYLISDVDANETTSPWFTKEIWGPVLAVTRLPGADVATFVANAVAFANKTLAGTLGANILIDPATARANRDTLDEAVANLDYGTIAVNAWSGVAYFMSKCAWGAFPGHTRSDIGSGVGFVHNALMFDKAQKSVVSGPFAPAPRTFAKGDFHFGPKMVYFVTNKQAHVIGEKLIDYCDRPTKAKLASIALSASRG
jgi:acyl-CoA reductase-like NAD-dependent aldehyde dehydrogenase